MKSLCLTLMSFAFIVGLCSAASEDTEIWQPLNTIHNNPTTIFQKIFSTFEDIKEYVSTKFEEIYNKLRGLKTKQEVQQAIMMNLRELPKFPESLHVPQFQENYQLSTLHFTNIFVSGMSNIREASFTIYKNEHKAVLILYTDSLTITGNYKMTNLFRGHFGSFMIKLGNNISYAETLFYHEHFHDEDITSHITMKYDSADYKFENAGFVMHLFQDITSDKISAKALQAAGRQIAYSVRPFILNKLHQIILAREYKQRASLLEETIKSAVRQTRVLLQNYTDFVLVGNDSTSESSFQNNYYSALIGDIQIFSFPVFEISQLRIPITDDKIQVHLKIHAGKLKGNVTVHVKEMRNNKEYPLQMDYVTDEIYFNVVLEKELLNSANKFELTHTEVILERILVSINSHPLFFNTLITQFLEQNLPDALRTTFIHRLTNFTVRLIKSMLPSNVAIYNQAPSFTYM